jgi:hypothetical protein
MVPMTSIEAILRSQVQLTAKGQTQRAILAAAGRFEKEDEETETLAVIRVSIYGANPGPAHSSTNRARRERPAVTRIPRSKICERNSLFRTTNSLFRTEQGIRRNPLTTIIKDASPVLDSRQNREFPKIPCLTHGAQPRISPLNSRPFGVGFGAQVERAAHADVVEMRLQEMLRRAASVVVEHAEEIVVGRQLAVGGVGLVAVAQHDAVRIDPGGTRRRRSRAAGGPGRSPGRRTRWRGILRAATS